MMNNEIELTGPIIVKLNTILCIKNYSLLNLNAGNGDRKINASCIAEKIISKTPISYVYV